MKKLKVTFEEVPGPLERLSVWMAKRSAEAAERRAARKAQRELERARAKEEAERLMAEVRRTALGLSVHDPELEPDATEVCAEATAVQPEERKKTEHGCACEKFSLEVAELRRQLESLRSETAEKAAPPVPDDVIASAVSAARGDVDARVDAKLASMTSKLESSIGDIRAELTKAFADSRSAVLVEVRAMLAELRVSIAEAKRAADEAKAENAALGKRIPIEPKGAPSQVGRLQGEVNRIQDELRRIRKDGQTLSIHVASAKAAAEAAAVAPKSEVTTEDLKEVSGNVTRLKATVDALQADLKAFGANAAEALQIGEDLKAKLGG
jgi:hypothetical protein